MICVLLQEIGSGSSGSIVYRAKWRSTLVAVKIFRTSFFSNERDLKDFENELKLLSSLRYVLEFDDIFQEDCCLFLAFIATTTL